MWHVPSPQHAFCCRQTSGTVWPRWRGSTGLWPPVCMPTSRICGSWMSHLALSPVTKIARSHSVQWVCNRTAQHHELKFKKLGLDMHCSFQFVIFYFAIFEFQWVWFSSEGSWCSDAVACSVLIFLVCLMNWEPVSRKWNSHHLASDWP